MRNKTVVLFLAHHIDEFILEQFYLLEKSIYKYFNLFFLFHDDNNLSWIHETGLPFYKFTTADLSTLRYTPIEETILPGSNHFPLFLYYKSNPSFEYYWIIEYDVYYKGDWLTFFDSFLENDSDFISSHIETYLERPEWDHWSRINTQTDILSQEELLKSFNPIYRISSKGINVVKEFLFAGNSGHHEIVYPTIIKKNGLNIMDMGGIGSFVPDGWHNRFYVSNAKKLCNYYVNSSMRYRPMYTKKMIEESKETDKLFHPVKYFY